MKRKRKRLLGNLVIYDHFSHNSNLKQNKIKEGLVECYNSGLVEGSSNSGT
jgi:hypothetical protein